jgi:hypothetical protein
VARDTTLIKDLDPRAPVAASDRERAGKVYHRPRGRHGRQRLPALPLTCLAPDIVEAILDGRQPKGLRLAEVLGNGPLAWEEQRVSWGL